MVKQIKIDENNVVVCCSIGGMIEGGMNVDFIPDEVLKCPAKWIYENDTYLENPDYIPPEPPPPEITTEDLALAVAELAEASASDKLEMEMAMAELAEMITGGV